MDELTKARNHLKMYTDYYGEKGTLDSLTVAQVNVSIAMAVELRILNETLKELLERRTKNDFDLLRRWCEL